ncbi:MAG: ATP synthase F1 subunit delta [Alphaproteobacteria bacterium]|nr:ATP synthase F1 subunit delta [Alphaproteobacteria bacterium]
MAFDSSSLIAERYARALFALGRQKDALAPLLADVQALSAWMKENAAFRRAVKSPVIDAGIKAKALDAVLQKAGAHALTRQFVRRLSLNNRLNLLPLIAGAFAALARAESGELAAQVISAKPLTEAQISAITKALHQATGKQVKIETSVDKRLLGGLKVQIGSTLLDASLSGKLTRLGKALKQAA